MANMSYCRFQNTAADLRDCVDHIDEELSEAEHQARLRMLKLCADFLRHAGVDISDADLSAARKEVNGWQ